MALRQAQAATVTRVREEVAARVGRDPRHVLRHLLAFLSGEATVTAGAAGAPGGGAATPSPLHGGQPLTYGRKRAAAPGTPGSGELPKSLRALLLGPAPARDHAAFYPASSLRSAGIRRLHDNMGTVLRSIVRKEGAWALTRGLLPRMVVNGPASAATFVMYEQVLALSRKPAGAAADGGEGSSMIALAR